MAKDTSKTIFQNDFTHILLVQDSLYEQNIVKKSFKRSKTGNDIARTLRNEFDITQKLEIEGIRKALAFENNESPCLLLEYIAGKNLDEILNESSLSIKEVLDIGISLCKILHETTQKNISIKI